MCSNDRKPRFAQLFETRRSNTCLNICPSGHYRDAMATEDSPAGRAGSRSRGKAHSKVSELPDGPPDATGLTPSVTVSQAYDALLSIRRTIPSGSATAMRAMRSARAWVSATA